MHLEGKSQQFGAKWRRIHLKFVMRATVTIDDELYERAFEMAIDAMTADDLIREALETVVRVQEAKRQAALSTAAH